jgi:NAD(P)-dependent dehydrogenase (short-subunit alcohol dehydrogenase family)
MSTKTVLITGANSGIGKAATLKFAGEGHTVVMGCRNLEKSKPVMEVIRAESNNSHVYLEELDVSSIDSIRSFCSMYKDKYQKLDILINNAAYFNHGADYELSTDGIEITFATNVLGPYLLTVLLRDVLSKSDDPRVLNAGSNIIKHFLNPKKEIHFSNLRGENINDPAHSVYINYRNSKMALLMLTFKLAEEFHKDRIKVNSIQINGAKMSKEALQKVKPGWRIIARIQNLFFRMPEFTAILYYDFCTAEEFMHQTGKHFNHRKEVMVPAKVNSGIITDLKQGVGASVFPAYALDKQATEKVWQTCKELSEISMK